MPSWRRSSRVMLAGLSAAALVPLATGQAVGSPPAPVPSTATSAAASSDAVKAKLGDADVQRLDTALQGKRAAVTVAVVTRPGAARAVAAQVRAAGGEVRRVDDRVGYLSARLAPAAVSPLTASASVVAVDLDHDVPLDDPRPATTPLDARAHAVAAEAPGAGTPDDNPYMPTRDTGAVAFKQAHPEWDGRGTTIGVVDSGIDLDHPALQTTSTGARKVVDVFNAVGTAEGDPEWLAMSTAVSGPSFSFNGATYTAPDGDYRVALLREAPFSVTELGGDVNRDGDTADSWAVLYDPVTHDVRVDTDGDRDLTDDAALQPYGVAYQVGHLGTDDPATGVVERVAFTVDWKDGTTPYVSITMAAAAHGTHVSGIAAGHSLFGGAMDGAAPGAQLVMARACISSSCSAVALTDGVAELVTNRHVDVVNISIGGLPALNDGNNARAELYNRLIEDYGVQIVISAGNSGPGVNTVGDPAVATSTLAVAASVTKETWASNYGSEVQRANSLFTFSSRGPREDGALKPDVAAPGSAISTVPTWQPGGPVPEAGYPLPAGYAMFNGTSMAAPQTTGDAALLLSAAKAQGVTATPAKLRQALRSSADQIAGIATYAQGAGLVDVPGAWALLSQAGDPLTYTVSAPVCTALSGFLATPGRGAGVYNDCLRSEGGQRPDRAKNYVVTVTRTSGPTGVQRHTLSWVGNDGTFAVTRAKVDLPLNQPVKVNITATPKKRDIESALLAVDLPSTVGTDLLVPVAVVSSTSVATGSNTVTRSVSVQRNSTTSVFVEVPVGTKALDVDLSGLAEGSQTRFIAFTPYGVPVESTSSLSCYANFPSSGCNPTHRTYASPQPGVWEIEVESRRTSPVLDNPAVLTLKQLNATVSPSPDDLGTLTSGTPVSREYTVSNTGATATLSLGGATFESVRRATPSITDGASQQYQITVPAGSTRLRVQIGSPSDPGADLDLLLYRCAPSCTLVAQSAGGTSEEAVSLANPPAGTYIALVDGYAVPAGTTTYSMVDAIMNAAYGSVSVTSTPTTLAKGESATFPATVTALQGAPAGRSLEATLPVTGPGNALVGTGLVRVQEVVPAS